VDGKYFGLSGSPLFASARSGRSCWNTPLTKRTTMATIVFNNRFCGDIFLFLFLCNLSLCVSYIKARPRFSLSLSLSLSLCLSVCVCSRAVRGTTGGVSLKSEQEDRKKTSPFDFFVTMISLVPFLLSSSSSSKVSRGHICHMP